MAVMRVHKTKDYTVMSNTHFREREMSLKAKGLLSLMFSLPDTWDYSIAGLVAICKENETAIKSTLKELKKFGYLSVTKLLPNETESGRIEYIYDIYETPNHELRGEKQEVENLGVVLQEVEKPVQLNTNILNTKEKRTKYKDKIDKSEYSLAEPNNLTKKLIEIEYIEPDDLCIEEYNNIFYELIDKYGFEITRSCLWYFINRYKTVKTDEDGNEIINKLAYFKTAMHSGAGRLVINNELADGSNGVGSWLYN